MVPVHWLKVVLQVKSMPQNMHAFLLCLFFATVMISSNVVPFLHGYFISNRAITWLPQCQWGGLQRYGKYWAICNYNWYDITRFTVYMQVAGYTTIMVLHIIPNIGHNYGKQCLKLSQKSCRSSCLESQIINIKLKKNQQKVPGPPPKLSALDWRTCGNFQHWWQEWFS